MSKKYYAVPSEFDGDQYDREEFMEEHGVSSYTLDWAIVDEFGRPVASTGQVSLQPAFPEEQFAMDEGEKDNVIATHFNGHPFPYRI